MWFASLRGICHFQKLILRLRNKPYIRPVRGGHAPTWESHYSLDFASILMAFSHIFCWLYVTILPEKWHSHDFQSRESQVATRYCLRHFKQKKLQETSTYCVQCRKKWVTFVGSTFVPTSSSLDMDVFFQKIMIKLTKCVPKLLAAWNLVYSVLISEGKIQHLTF